MRFFGLVLCLIVTGLAATNLSVTAQQDPSVYLRQHHYAFSPAIGFEGPLSDTLTAKLSAYHLIFQAEGGSHYLNLYDTLELAWLKFLSKRLNLTCFIGESGTSEAVLFNRYLKHGDSSSNLRKRFFFADLYRYNASLPPSQRLYYSGIDFERPFNFMTALKALLPKTDPPESLRTAVGQIRNAPDSGYDCDAILVFNKQLRKSLDAAEAAFRQYFGAGYPDLEKIVRNNGNCKDALRNRNDHMANNFLSLDQAVHANYYFGEFGEAHTILNHRNLASLIARDGAFRDKVAVINLYCYDCTTPHEAVSNWPLKGIEADVLRFFLPLCESEYTIFDLSGDDPAISRYKAYGQWLIVAKGAH